VAPLLPPQPLKILKHNFKTKLFCITQRMNMCLCMCAYHLPSKIYVVYVVLFKIYSWCTHMLLIVLFSSLHCWKSKSSGLSHPFLLQSCVHSSWKLEHDQIYVLCWWQNVCQFLKLISNTRTVCKMPLNCSRASTVNIKLWKHFG
jgi:hypothetical protein